MSLQAPRAHRDDAGHIVPHGGELVNLMVSDQQQKKQLSDSCKFTQECSDRNACDVELLTVGGFSPLRGFMNRDVYDHVVASMRSVTSGAGCADEDVVIANLLFQVTQEQRNLWSSSCV